VRKLAVLFLFVVVACGKRGDPHPPIPVIPKAATDLLVAQRGPKVLLSWSYPSMTTAGRNISGIKRVVIWRTVDEQPGAQPMIATRFLKLRTRVDSIEGANLPAATTGARLTYEDTAPAKAADGHAPRVNYAVVTEGMSANSDLSNLVSIVPMDVPVAPADLAAVAQREGVVLTWKAPESAIGGTSKPSIAGYNVYRFPHNQPSDEFATPVNPAPITATTFTDTPPYGQHDYFVTAVAAVGPPRIESDPSTIAGATFKDLIPPPPPTNLTALVETAGVRLVWDAADAPDMAGYKVYRTEGTGIDQLKPVGTIPMTPVQLITATNYRDTSVNRGISYYYEVVSVDKTGNESTRVKTDWVLVPKTP
jgi:hypothetical protein